MVCKTKGLAVNIRLAANLSVDSVVDGPGLRTVIWCQGCPHDCPECHNPHTHAVDGGFIKDADEVVAEVLAVDMQSGVTFSGGEPMLQPESCAYIASKLKEKGRNIWCYTGFTFEQLLENPSCREFLQWIDVLVDGQFMVDRKSYKLPFRGSANQRLILVQESLARQQIVCAEEGRE